MNVLKLGIGPFLGGIVFAIGLGVAGMTEPAKIISFLDIFGAWDPSLAFVMVGAIGVNAVLHRFIVKREKPVFTEKFYLPTRSDFDKNLVIGAALFGIGWGVTGLCPGPGLASLITGKNYALAFVAALLVGMAIAKFATRPKTRSKTCPKASPETRSKSGLKNLFENRNANQSEHQLTTGGS